MKNDEMIATLEALANNVDIETGEVIELNDRTISAIYKALYELKNIDKDNKINEKSSNLIDKKISQLDDNDRELFETLREYRNNLSRENGFRAYTLGSNRALLNMVYHKPTKENFLTISGVGKFINDNFADGYTTLIKMHLDSSINENINSSQIANDNNHRILEVSSSNYFKIENYPSVRLFNKQWTGNISDLNKIRHENHNNNRLLNAGLPLTIEEAELFNQWIEQGKTLSELQKFFQRNIKKISPFKINRSDFRTFHFNSND